MSGKQYSLDSRMDLVHGIVSNVSPRPTSDPSNNGTLPLTVEDFSEIEESDNKSGSVLFCQMQNLILNLN